MDSLTQDSKLCHVYVHVFTDVLNIMFFTKEHVRIHWMSLFVCVIVYNTKCLNFILRLLEIKYLNQ